MKSCSESCRNHLWEYMTFSNIRRCYRCGLMEKIKKKENEIYYQS